MTIRKLVNPTGHLGRGKGPGMEEVNTFLAFSRYEDFHPAVMEEHLPVKK